MATKMEKRVAKALAKLPLVLARQKELPLVLARQKEEHSWEPWLPHACAAIKAMQKPTRTMVCAGLGDFGTEEKVLSKDGAIIGVKVFINHSPKVAREIYRRMVEAARGIIA